MGVCGALAGLRFWARSAIRHWGAPSAPLSSPKSPTLIKGYSQGFMFFSVRTYGWNYCKVSGGGGLGALGLRIVWGRALWE